MIQFFRKIRKALINEGKTSKYFKYAIGEILLVVIGILLALQINNWNETRKKEDKLNATYLEVQRELANNIKEISKSIDFYEKKDSIIYLILNDKLTKEDYIENPVLAYALEGFRTYNLQNKGYLNLNSNLDLIPKKFNPILQQLNNVYDKYGTSLKEANADFSNHIIDYFKNLSNTKSWYVNYSYHSNYKNEEFLDYIINDPIYKNKVYDYLIFTSNLFLSDIKIQSILAYKSLAEITGNKDDLDHSIYFQSVEDLKKYTGVFKIKNEDKVYNVESNSNIIEISLENELLTIEIFDRKHTVYPHEKNVFIFGNKDNAKVTFKFKDSEVIGLHFFNISYYTDWEKVK